ncbi:MAG: sugar phosphate isomerase/epimerase [Armatimonadota bacterium]
MLCGYQAVYDTDFRDAIDYAKDNLFDYVSFDLNVPRFYIDRMTTLEMDSLRAHADEAKVGLAFHAPGDNVSLFSDYPAIRQGMQDHFGAIIDAAESLGARHLVVHAGIYPSFRMVRSSDEDFITEHETYYKAVLYDNFAYLAGRTKNILLCVENFQFSPLTMSVVDRLLGDTEQLSLTWDIAKTYDLDLALDEPVEEFMWKHRCRIREVHAHDTIRQYHSHQVVGEGGIDFTRYASVILSPDVGVTFEVRPREAATISRDHLIGMLKTMRTGMPCPNG